MEGKEAGLRGIGRFGGILLGLGLYAQANAQVSVPSPTEALATLTPAQRSEMINCIATAAGFEPFAAQSDTQLATSQKFVDAVRGTYCSNEVGPIRDMARKLPPPPNIGDEPDPDKLWVNRSIITLWDEARPLRGQAPVPPRERQQLYLLSWQLTYAMEDNPRDIEAAVKCVARALRKAPPNQAESAAIGTGTWPPRFEPLRQACNMAAIETDLTRRMKAGFARFDPDLVDQAARDLLARFTFWAMLSPG